MFGFGIIPLIHQSLQILVILPKKEMCLHYENIIIINLKGCKNDISLALYCI